MDDKIFEMSIANQKNNEIVRIVIEALLMLLVGIAIFLYVMNIWIEHPQIFEAVLIIATIAFVHCILNVVWLAINFRRSLRMIEFSDDRVTINDDVFLNDQGISYTINGGLLSIGYNSHGFDLCVRGSDISGNVVVKTYWLGPTRNSYCKARRLYLRDFIRDNCEDQRVNRMETLEDKLKEGPYTVRMSTQKLNRSLAMYSVISLVTAAVFFVIMILFAKTFMSRAIYLFTIGMFAFMGISNLLLFSANKKNRVREVELTTGTIRINDDIYEIKEGLEVNFFIIGNPIPGKTGIEYRPAKRPSDTGVYLEVVRGPIETRYWLAPDIDNEAARVFVVSKYVNLITKGVIEP